jgi:hypothetical protein
MEEKGGARARVLECFKKFRVKEIESWTKDTKPEVARRHSTTHGGLRGG